MYFAIEDEKIILLLTAGPKADQKRDIARALKYYNEYKERNNEIK